MRAGNKRVWWDQVEIGIPPGLVRGNEGGLGTKAERKTLGSATSELRAPLPTGAYVCHRRLSTSQHELVASATFDTKVILVKPLLASSLRDRRPSFSSDPGSDPGGSSTYPELLVIPKVVLLERGDEGGNAIV